jgi:hypothetical protein
MAVVLYNEIGTINIISIFVENSKEEKHRRGRLKKGTGSKEKRKKEMKERKSTEHEAECFHLVPRQYNGLLYLFPRKLSTPEMPGIVDNMSKEKIETETP